MRYENIRRGKKRPAPIMLSKKLLSKQTSGSPSDFDMTEKVISMGEEEAFKMRAGRKRHSVQLDKRITQQLLQQDRRPSNASSTGDSVDSVCKFVCCVRFFLPGDSHLHVDSRGAITQVL